MDLVKVICPDFPEDKKVQPTVNHERWFKVINGTLYVPTETILKGNFLLLDKFIEALHNFEISEPEKGWWDDTLVSGKHIKKLDECLDVLDTLGTYKTLAVDIETRDTGYDGNKVLLIGFAYCDYDSVVIDAVEPKVIEALQKLFNKKDVTFIWQNGKFDTTRLKYLLGIDARIDEDTMLQQCCNIT